jgi:hypothetical protein
MKKSASNSASASGAKAFQVSVALVQGALLTALVLSGGTAWGRGRPPPASPDIVYMSSSSKAPARPAIRGVSVTITGDTVSSTDTQLAKALAGRDWTSIAWSPDGSRFAWIEGQAEESRKIMWARPGNGPAVLYQPSDVSDAYVSGGSDGLAWASDACSGDGGSILVFARAPKWDATRQQYTELPAIMGIDIDPASPDSTPGHGSPRVILMASNPNGFAFSPTGDHLAFNAGYGTNEKVSLLPMCGSSPTPMTLLIWDDFRAARYPHACDDNPGSACPCGGNSETVCFSYPDPAVQSIDWSGDARRLALSVTVGPDPAYDWRDLRVAYLDWNEAGQTFAKSSVVDVQLDSAFGSASSEHSPQWGPSAQDNDCERLAFSQSAGAIDGSTMNGRRLYLYDLVASNTACFSGPREMSARDPRAIDWK